MKIIKIITASSLSIILGLIFLYSGYSKLYPVIETFEFSLVDIGIANWYTAPIFARLLVSLEFFTGILLISNFNLKKFTLPLTIIALVIFSIYLITTMLVNGNTGNCGCFGEHFYMTPFQALIKNILMLLLCVAIYFFSDGWKTRFQHLLISFIAITCVITPFILNPVDYTYTSNNLEEKINYPLALNLLYEPEDISKVEIPNFDLRKGKQVLAFMSLTCHHCRVAAKKFKVIHKKNPSLPIYFILNGEKNKLNEFLEDTKCDNIPYSFCLGKTFVQLAAAQLPRIYYLDNEMVVKKVDYFELNQYEIEKWIKGN